MKEDGTERYYEDTMGSAVRVRIEAIVAEVCESFENRKRFDDDERKRITDMVYQAGPRNDTEARAAALNVAMHPSTREISFEEDDVLTSGAKVEATSEPDGHGMLMTPWDYFARTHGVLRLAEIYGITMSYFGSHAPNMSGAEVFGSITEFTTPREVQDPIRRSLMSPTEHERYEKELLERMDEIAERSGFRVVKGASIRSAEDSMLCIKLDLSQWCGISYIMTGR